MDNIINTAQTPTVSTNMPSQTIIKPQKRNRNKKLVTFLSIFLIVVTILLTIFFFTIFIPAKKILTQVNAIKSEYQIIQQSVNDKDLAKIKVSLVNIKSDTQKIESTYKKMGLLNIIPGIRKYYQDGQKIINIAYQGIDSGEIVIQAIEPYQDFLGIKGSSESSEKTTEDRIAFLTESAEGLIPYLDELEVKISNIETELNQINPNRYPDKYKNIEIKSKISQAQETVTQISELVKNGKPLLTKISWLLGKDSPRQYLMVFQNDGELRPSGGFWTAYSTMTVSNGKVTPGTASNIYDLDDRLKNLGKAPRLISSYHINVPYLYLRDANLSPDFPTDAQLFLEQYTKAMKPKTEFDAVIAIDTQLLADMVKVLGKLDTRVGTFTSEPDNRCNGCPSIIYEIEWMAGRPRDYIELNRKDFLNPLMSALLANVMGSEKSKMTSLIEAFFKNVNQKHILVYFTDKEMQTVGNSANITGQITQTAETIDYLHLNDTNFASAKSNMFITQEIDHDITIKNGVAEHKVSVTYTNPFAASNCNLEKGDLCLNASKYRDLFRFYVPTGSTLTKMTGSEVETVQYEELGKQVFEGFYGDKYPLYPKSSSKVTVQYKSGVKVGSTYSLFLQKQPGTKAVEYNLTINGKKMDTFSWASDKTIKVSL